MSVRIVFSDAPPEAIQTTTVSTTGAYYYAEPDLLPRGANTGALATCELNSWGLTPEVKTWDDEKIGYWSEAMSNNNCIFATPPTITLDLGGQYSVSGLTFKFAPAVGEYCRRIFVEWFRDDAVIESGEFFPDAGDYALNKLVENFDKVKVTLKETSLPNRRAKLEMLGIGIVRDYGGDCIEDISIDREIDIMSLTLPISSVDVTFQTPAPVDLYFFKRQIVDVYIDDNLEGRYFVENSNRISEKKYTLSAQDLISEMDQYTTRSGWWRVDIVPVETHFENLTTDKLFKFELSEAMKNKSIPRGTEEGITVREAVQQIAFGSDAIVHTSGTSGVRVSQLGERETKTINSRDVYYGGSLEQSDFLTAVTLTGYEEDFPPSENTPTIDVFYMGGEPGDYGYYRWFYSESHKTLTNRNAEATRVKNHIEVSGCYIITPERLDEKTQELYNYYMRRRKYKFKHIVRGEEVGDRVRVPLPWGGTATGNILKMKITSTGLTVSDTEVLLDEEV